jgi:hypothetical protein
MGGGAKDTIDHLVEIFCRLLVLEGLDSSKETKVEGV